MFLLLKILLIRELPKIHFGDITAPKTPDFKVCSFLDKPSRRRVPVAPDYNGFTIEDHFIVGYGLDYAEQYRNLPMVSILLNQELMK